MKRRTLRAFGIAICSLGLLLSGHAQAPSAHKARKAESRWTIGIYTGPSPLRLSPHPKTVNPVLRAADVHDLKNVDTLAYPFMVIEGSHYYMFFTTKYLKTEESGIGLGER